MSYECMQKIKRSYFHTDNLHQKFFLFCISTSQLHCSVARSISPKLYSDVAETTNCVYGTLHRRPLLCKEGAQHALTAACSSSGCANVCLYLLDHTLSQLCIQCTYDVADVDRMTSIANAEIPPPTDADGDKANEEGIEEEHAIAEPSSGESSGLIGNEEEIEAVTDESSAAPGDPQSAVSGGGENEGQVVLEK